MSSHVMPKISVVTPSYNQGKYLEQTIRSVLDQGYPNLEYIIMDGGSTDNSVEIIKKYADKLAYWQSQPDGGQSAAINAGMVRATGDVQCWLNSDDYFASGALAKVGAAFAGDSSIQWLAGFADYINPNGKVRCTIVPERLDFATLKDWFKTCVCQSAVFWRRELWAKAGPLNEKLELAMDPDLWFRFSRIQEGMIVKELLACCNFHPEAKTQRCFHVLYAELALVLSCYGEFELARAMLSRPLKRIFELDNRFSLITRNPLYRYWRDRRG